MKFTRSAAVLTASLLSPLTLAAQLTIAADITPSSAVGSSPEFANAVAARVESHIKALPYGTRVSFRTVGDNSLDDSKARRLTISRRIRPDKAAQMVGGALRSLPKQHKKEFATYLLQFLENTDFACGEDGSALWLLTDGIEASVDANGMEVVDGRAPLPKPYGTPLAGCDVVMVGIGKVAAGQLSRAQIQNLKSAWTAWLSKAGAKSVQLIVSP